MYNKCLVDKRKIHFMLKSLQKRQECVFGALAPFPHNMSSSHSVLVVLRGRGAELGGLLRDISTMANIMK